MPTYPVPLTKKCVADDEPMTNSGTPLPRAFGFTERSPHGVDEAMPILPVLPMMVRADVEVVACDVAEEVEM